MKAALVFGVAAVLDVVWAYYIQYVAAKQPVRAGIFGALTVGLGAFNLTAIVGDPRYVAPAMLGAFLGTYWTVRRP